MSLYKKTYIYNNVIYKRVINDEACNILYICTKFCKYSNGRPISCTFEKPCDVLNVLHNSSKIWKGLTRIHYVPD